MTLPTTKTKASHRVRINGENPVARLSATRGQLLDRRPPRKNMHPNASSQKSKGEGTTLSLQSLLPVGLKKRNPSIPCRVATGWSEAVAAPTKGIRQMYAIRFVKLNLSTKRTGRAGASKSGKDIQTYGGSKIFTPRAKKIDRPTKDKSTQYTEARGNRSSRIDKSRRAGNSIRLCHRLFSSLRTNSASA